MESESEYITKLIKATKNYLRSSTCHCGYKGNFCPQEELQSILDECLSTPSIRSTPIRRKKK